MFFVDVDTKKSLSSVRVCRCYSVKQHLSSVACHGGRGGQRKGCYAARVENLIEVRPVYLVEKATFDVSAGWREAGLGACPKGS